MIKYVNNIVCIKRISLSDRRQWTVVNYLVVEEKKGCNLRNAVNLSLKLCLKAKEGRVLCGLTYLRLLLIYMMALS